MLGVSLFKTISVTDPSQIEGVKVAVTVGGTNELLFEKIKLLNKIKESRM